MPHAPRYFMPRFQSCAAALSLLALMGCSAPSSSTSPAQMGRAELADRPAIKRIAKTAAPSGAMVVAANPLASAAGAKVLREGGSAVDAAIAVQAVL